MPNGEFIQFILMRQQITRFGDDRRVAVECCVGFAGGFSRGIMRGSYVRDSKPLRFAINSIERLIPGVCEFQKMIRPLLNG